MRHANLTILATVLSFVLGVFGMAATEKQFFPSSDRAELLVEMWLPEGSSLKATELEAKRLENILLADKQVSTFVSYVGNGSPRYYLSLDQQLYRPNFAQFVILTSDVASRDQVLASLRRQLAEDFPGVRARVFRTPLGPPVAYPIQFRVMGPDPVRLKEIAAQVADQVRANPNTVETHIDWGDRSPVLRVEVDQDKARAAAVSTAQIRRSVSSTLNGTAIGQYRENDQLIDIVLRSTPDETRATRSYCFDTGYQWIWEIYSSRATRTHRVGDGRADLLAPQSYSPPSRFVLTWLMGFRHLI